MAGDDRFSSLKEESNPFKEHSRRNRGRGSRRGASEERTPRTSEDSSESTSMMAQTFGTYLEQQLGAAPSPLAPTMPTAYVPPGRVRNARTAVNQVNLFKGTNREQRQGVDIGDSNAFPELGRGVENEKMSAAQTSGAGWKSNGVDMVSKASTIVREEPENDNVRPGWVRLSNGKVTYGPPSSNYERVIYHMYQARNSALNELRRRHEQYRQYDYEMYGDRWLYEERLGCFSDDEDDEDESVSGDGGSSNCESDGGDTASDDWY
jgi:hypothetical protein